MWSSRTAALSQQTLRKILIFTGRCEAEEGNFGVVTSLEFRLHPVSTVQFGPTFWPLEDAAEVLSAYRNFIQKAPEDISGLLRFPGGAAGPDVPRAPAPQNRVWNCVVLHGFSRGDRKGAEADSFARPSAVRPRWSRAFSGGAKHVRWLFVPGLQWYWRADNFTEVNDEAVARHVEHGSKIPTMLSTMHLYPINAHHNASARTTPHTASAKLYSRE